MHRSSIANSKQGGAAMLVILFVTVLVAFFSARLMSMNVQSSQANTFEVMSSRAYWAARSALEKQVTNCFPVNAPINEDCRVAIETLFFPLDGVTQYPGCSAIPVVLTPDNDATTDLIHIESTAVCSEGAYRVSRQVEVEVRL